MQAKLKSMRHVIIVMSRFGKVSPISPMPIIVFILILFLLVGLTQAQMVTSFVIDVKVIPAYVQAEWAIGFVTATLFRVSKITTYINLQKPNKALKPTRFRYAPAVGLALR